MGEFSKKWIVENGIPIVESYGGNITLRALHYQLVARGMTNDVSHYKKVVSAMIDARWSGEVGFDAFLDHERETIGKTDIEATTVLQSSEQAKNQIWAWATSYHKNKWENQPDYVEVFIEKKALQGVFQKPCEEWNVALNPCKGYPSLTFLYDATKRYCDAVEKGKRPVILYFGDYDCSGEDIPRSISDNLEKMMIGIYGSNDFESINVKRIALKLDQVKKWKLPPAPTKTSDTRSRKWTGIGQVELDAVDPHKIERLCNEAIESVFNQTYYDDLQEQEKEEKIEFRKILKRDFKSLLD